MRLLYSLAICCYSGLVGLAAFFGHKKAKLWWKGRDRQWDSLKPSAPEKNAPWLWMHVSSLGEFEQGLPLLESLKEKFPQYKILLTFFSPSGYEVKKDLQLVDKVAYMPSDTLSNARKLVRLYNFKAAFFVKYDFWFNYIKTLSDNKIPIYYISALLYPNYYFFKFYASWFRKHLRLVTRYFVQNEETAELLKSIGINQVVVNGDTRFDRVYSIAKQAKTFPDIEKFINGRKCVIAGSSWPSDERFLYPFIERMPENYCLIMAPHDISETHLNQIQSHLKDYQLYTSLNPDIHNKVLVINTIGVLSKIYIYARFAYIGGGFIASSIHNIQEAVIAGCPVVFGPRYKTFVEAVDLVALKGAFTINTQEDVDKIFDLLVNDDDFLRKASKICKEYVGRSIGATEKIIANIGSEL